MKTNMCIDASEPDVYMGIGSVAYVLTKVDGNWQPQKMEMVHKLFAQEPYGDLAVNFFLIQEYQQENPETAYAFAMRRLKASRHVLSQHLKERLVALLRKVAEIDHQITAREHALLCRFQQDIQLL